MSSEDEDKRRLRDVFIRTNVSWGMSEISCDEHEFQKAKGDYDKALEKSGVSVRKISTINRVLCTNKQSYMA